jgi:HEAT repeat protein
VERGSKSPWTLFLEALGYTFGNLNRLRQPVGAFALVAIGFFAARLMGSLPVFTSPAKGGTNLASVLGPSDDAYSTVRSVQPDGSGGVVISYDETRRRMVKGNMNDADVQRLLVAAAHEDNPAVRGESVSVLKNQSRSTEVRDTLIELAQDPNNYVRLNAIEGLKPIASDPQVRRVLAQVLRADDNDAVKMQAIDLLTEHRDDTVVGLMQALVQREQSNSVRLKMEKALREMNASIGTF